MPDAPLTEQQMKDAHKLSIRHRKEVLSSEVCGCFCCVRAFPPLKIEEWTDKQQTALCPRCGIDSVIGDKSHPIDRLFLKQMCKYWFGRIPDNE